jgi:hypothetical protein
MLLVRDGDQELWIPYTGETDEELDELLATARATPAEDPDAEVVGGSRRSLRPLRNLVIGVGSGSSARSR